MRLGVILAPGESLSVLRESGQDVRLLRYYIPYYEKSFHQVSLFTFDAENQTISRTTSIVANRFRLNRFLYLVLMPFLTSLGTCDVIRVTQATSIFPAILAKCLFGNRVVVTFGYDYVAFAKAEERRLLAFLLAYYLQLLRFADAIIVTTRKLARIVKRYAGSAKVVLIPNGVDLDQFRPTGKPAGPPWNVLYVGRMEPPKNVDTLIRAIASIKRSMQIHLMCVGVGSESVRLSELARQLGINATFTGVVPHTKLPQILAQAHAFVLISSIEGHPKGLIEALAAGVPCLVSKEAGRAVGMQDGKEGLIVSAEVDDVGKGLQTLLTGAGLDRMGKNARALALSKYDVRKLLGKEVRVLISLCVA